MFFELEKGQRISFSQLLRWLSMQQNTGASARRRPVDLGMPFLQGFVFHMVLVRVNSNYYSFYRLGSASETLRDCCALPSPFAHSLSFSTPF